MFIVFSATLVIAAFLVLGVSQYRMRGIEKRMAADREPLRQARALVSLIDDIPADLLSRSALDVILKVCDAAISVSNRSSLAVVRDEADREARGIELTRVAIDNGRLPGTSTTVHGSSSPAFVARVLRDLRAVDALLSVMSSRFGVPVEPSVYQSLKLLPLETQARYHRLATLSEISSRSRSTAYQHFQKIGPVADRLPDVVRARLEITEGDLSRLSAHVASITPDQGGGDRVKREWSAWEKESEHVEAEIKKRFE